MEIAIGIIFPLIGTSLGALFVFFGKKNLSELLKKIMLSFSAGVMLASAIWSLIIPSISLSINLSLLQFLPALIGISLGSLFIIFCDKLNVKYKNDKIKKMIFVIILHNIPEGLAVGVAIASALRGNINIYEALALAFGIGIQNIPEGAIVSLPLLQNKCSKIKAFIVGILSGIVEPIAAIIAIMIGSSFLLPYLLAFAAGAMLFVVVDELIPEGASCISSLFFIIGFLIMMILDVILS